MNSSNNLISILIKATILASILFWTLIFSEKPIDEPFIIIVVIVSIIPISIVCSFTILLTVMPFYWLEQNKLKENEIFKKYFPYYSIITFGICYYSVMNSNFNIGVSAFCITVFFTLMQSWVWAGKITVDYKKNTNLKSEIHDTIQ